MSVKLQKSSGALDASPDFSGWMLHHGANEQVLLLLGSIVSIAVLAGAIYLVWHFWRPKASVNLRRKLLPGIAHPGRVPPRATALAIRPTGYWTLRRRSGRGG
jgi:hypothetical protein